MSGIVGGLILSGVGAKVNCAGGTPRIRIAKACAYWARVTEIMVGDTTPPVQALAEHGVARVSHGPGPYLMAMKALEEAARAAGA
jgi:2-methylisocitrate lyase-like PEP mutase family enzyme